MKLKVRTLGLDAGGKTIVIINIDDAREFGVHPLERILLRHGRKSLTVIVNITKKFVKPGEVVVYREVREILGLKAGDFVDACPRKEMISKYYIRKKVDGAELNYKEIRCIVDDVVDRNLNDLEMSSFITALHIHGLSMNETVALSKSMVETSEKLSFPGIVVDKHSIGGICGDKTSMLLVPIIVSCGLTIPKTSSRAITSPAGTADRMEILAPVELGVEEIKRVVRRAGGCLVWGGAIDLAPADDLFIQIENPLCLDPLMLPSVMSKKKAVGSKYVVIDIPTGSGAKVKKSGFRALSTNFKTLGKKLGIKVDCISTKGNQPIGYAIGPALEAREALETIMGLNSPKDLINKVLTLSGSLLKMCKKGDTRTAERVLRSGEAEKKLREIIACQGGYEKIKPGDIPYADNMAEIRSRRSGVVSCIDDDTMACLARIAGAPRDRLAGIVLNKKLGNKVKRDEVLFTIYSERKHKLKSALKYVDKTRIYHVV